MRGRLTCPAGRVLGESGEGLEGGEAGPDGLPALLVDGVVDVARGTSL